MSALNPFKELLGLLPGSPLLVGRVVAVATGLVTVQYPGGGQQIARGAGYPINAQVFVRNGVVEGLAPSLTAVTIEV
jgi:hypothetical protein